MEIIEKAPAKINLGLDALYKRDDGYHELKMVMASVDLADKLIFRELEENQILIETDSSFLPVDKRNHIYQAAELLKERFGITKGVHVEVRKRIPVAAGLAGGSSDAAAALRGLNRLWHLDLSLAELAELGVEVGSDVPYCVRGNTAVVSGRGDLIKSLPAMPQCWVVLVKPRISVSTRTIFSSLSFNEIMHPNIGEIEAAVVAGDYQRLIANLGNSLEDITIQKHPVVQQIKDKMMKFGADAALMSGSGPTVFALCDKYSRAQRVKNGLRGFCEDVHIVRTLK
ncbi:4-(cytidine 5'-diphospho)-2-C-methyl-D-erythritol kinase [Vagococcus salmoninarum]|uniref:4-(cytidine 5'-diphospho)-2-C-methyl-D-erythritol kinase n=1 Tax=Vagococcus salmoninarum TaxID=2739 RepID=UPI00187E3CDC|nr:4-(cytidine 5'-diphospho)-2-C-methyl-D-erythritol kinase [Vagococcus salmoninarum]MBE9388262.1 4-(cytidine 5'-diphospho)-2-C-methyl-D-erythritol kinase [Vagococcus salmoninarum]